MNISESRSLSLSLYHSVSVSLSGSLSGDHFFFIHFLNSFFKLKVTQYFRYLSNFFVEYFFTFTWVTIWMTTFDFYLSNILLR